MPGLPPLRDWQTEASDAVRIEWREEDRNPLVAGCPACGKTRFGTEMAKLGLEDYGCGVVLCVSPTVNVKENWEKYFNEMGLIASAKVGNETLKDRFEYQESLVADKNALCITYAQLARGSIVDPRRGVEENLFAEMLRRHNGLLIADEPHHCDENESFGRILNLAAANARLRLALTGTPFNTSGTPLSMVPSVEDISPDGARIRRAVPTYEYSYGRAISEQVCRPIEFITVMGRGQVTYRSLANNTTWQRVVDLARANRTDRLTALLAPDGEFMIEMLETGIKALLDIKQTDRRAAMLVAAADTKEGRAISTLLRRLIAANPHWSGLSVTEVFHDTIGAHNRLDQLKSDHTDIVIAVRMISEGVDIPRLRVGVYGTNYLTRLFFTQLVGRFVRWEARLDGHQFAKLVIPAHINLLEWAREVEAMIVEAAIPERRDEGGGAGGEPGLIIDRHSVWTGKGAILRGDQESDITPAAEFFRRVPEAVGRVPDLLATIIERSYRQPAPRANANYDRTSDEARTNTRFVRNLRNDNTNLVRRIVRMLAQNGEVDDDAYRRVNGRANRAAGIRRLDDLTTDDELNRRADYLGRWLLALYRGDAFDEIA